jgi:hypothetical protein
MENTFVFLSHLQIVRIFVIWAIFYFGQLKKLTYVGMKPNKFATFYAENVTYYFWQITYGVGLQFWRFFRKISGAMLSYDFKIFSQKMDEKTDPNVLFFRRRLRGWCGPWRATSPASSASTSTRTATSCPPDPLTRTSSSGTSEEKVCLFPQFDGVKCSWGVGWGLVALPFLFLYPFSRNWPMLSFSRNKWNASPSPRQVDCFFCIQLVTVKVINEYSKCMIIAV